jgi:tripartite-type tricarboxylate transporter receptor subunit TctC
VEAIFLVCLAGLVCAQSAWPDKPVRIIVPTAEGSGSYLIARTLAQRLSEIRKQSSVDDNKAGASGIVGVDAVLKATPDGYTLLMNVASPIVINPVIFQTRPNDPLQQWVPVSHVGIEPAALLVNSATAVNTLKDLVALAKAQPKKLS